MCEMLNEVCNMYMFFNSINTYIRRLIPNVTVKTSRSHQVRLRVGGRIHLLCVSTVQHAQYGDIERGSGLSGKTFKWQSSKEGEAFKEDSFKDWMFSRPLALRPIYWEISSDAYTHFRVEHEKEMNTEIFGVPRLQIPD